jgi:hypothetical protein
MNCISIYSFKNVKHFTTNGNERRSFIHSFFELSMVPKTIMFGSYLTTHFQFLRLYSVGGNEWRTVVGVAAVATGRDHCGQRKLQARRRRGGGEGFGNKK